MFVENYVGGGELTSEAIINDSLLPIKKINSHLVNTKLLEQNRDKFWIFGNFSGLKDEYIIFAIKNLDYSVLEYDYKYCLFRSPEKHILNSGECLCHKERRGKLVSIFYAKSKATWFMSEKQRNVYLDKFPFLDNPQTKVLSSVFSQETLDYIEGLDCTNKNDKWIVLDSESWVKGKKEAVQYAEENNLNYELVWGIEYKDLLRKLADSKGLVYIPPGGDTCPRLIIEAKLLDCELILNDNVQHRNETWFETKEGIFKYLRERTKIFWSTMENLWELDTPESSDNLNHKFNLIVPFYNAGNWIGKCINSVKNQKYDNFKCYLIDDLSDDNTIDVITKEIASDNRFKLIKNTNKKYALGNIVDTLMNEDIKSEDINILLDGDDWLSSYNVLSYLDKIYTEGNCLLTYGTYVYHPTGRQGVEPSKYPDVVVENNSFRSDQWRASHLRTFKTKLFEHIDLEDLKNDDGHFFKTAYDQALMLPLLEIAGSRSQYIDKIMHVYNRENPLNVDKVKQHLQHQTAQKIRTKKPYERKF
tara:strand:+ start:121 stop:1713 length:1593 start_codon:yes stop_codon:yes gene_type:complete